MHCKMTMARRDWDFLIKAAMATVLLICGTIIALEREYLLSRILQTGRTSGNIILTEKSLENEGIGAVMSGLRQIFALADMTGYGIVLKKETTGHGYNVRDIIRFPKRRKRQKECDYHKLPMKVQRELQWGELNQMSDDSIREILKCDRFVVTQYLNHPRRVSPRTNRLIRQALAFDRSKENGGSCVLQRGGDVEHRIRGGKGNIWDIDYKRVRPVLDIVRKEGNQTVTVATEARSTGWIRERYGEVVLKNGGGPMKVMEDLYRCKCLFVAAGSSFAALVAQVTEADSVFYMTNTTDFKFITVPYNYSKMSNYHAVTDNATEMAKLCMR